MDKETINKSQEHVPVLLEQILVIAQERFAVKSSKSSSQKTKPVLKIWDATLGTGGHSIALTKKLEENFTIKLFASDHDQEMLTIAQQNITEQIIQNTKEENFSVQYAHANYSQNPFVQHAPFDLILLDLGISSLHYDFFERGFSFRYQQPLDMRMDSTLRLNAAEWLNSAKEKEIADILFRYGEEKHARKIAKKICQQRKEKSITTTFELKNICESCYPPGFSYNGRSHADRYPAVRTFQALRIFINQELENLQTALTFLPNLLSAQGILLIIAFHSLEDKLVKKSFQDKSRVVDNSPHARSHYKQGDFQVLQNRAMMASEQEIETNPRSRSARLRGLFRTGG